MRKREHGGNQGQGLESDGNPWDAQLTFDNFCMAPGHAARNDTLRKGWYGSNALCVSPREVRYWSRTQGCSEKWPI